jgi:ribosomal protein S18 acetylase RimI-like enzyme
MRIRRASEADEPVLRELWEEFEAEVPALPGDEESWEEAWIDVSRHLADGVALLAEDEEGPVGYLWVSAPAKGRAHVTDAYVRPRARRHGLAKEMLKEAVAELRGRGVDWVSLDVLTSNSAAIATWRALGFEEIEKVMLAGLAGLEAKLAEERPTISFGRVFVQTDDETAIDRAVQTFLPRLGRSERTSVSGPVDGWIAIDDELCSSDPKLLRRLAQEMSYRTGGVVLSLGIEEGRVVRYVLFDRGSIADEYASVPEYWGSLPPGDVVALSANPTVAHRLTGADPERLRSAARTAESPEELPPPEELYALLAEVLGVGSEL